MISPHFELTGEEAKGLLYGLLMVNKKQLRDNPSLPSMRQAIKDGRVRYRQLDPNEHWQSYREIMENVQRDGVAYADCEDLAPAVAAEDQHRYGVMSQPYAYRPRPGLFHVVTAVPTRDAERFGGIWPPAMGTEAVHGYVLQDVSAAAGMPTTHVRGAAYGGIGKPFSRLASSFSEGLLGGRFSATEVGQAAGSASSRAARQALGLSEGNFAKGLSEVLLDRAMPRPQQGRSQSSPDADEEDFEDDLEDEDFGAFAWPQYTTGIFREIRREPIDLLPYPMTDDEEDAISEQVVLENFGGQPWSSVQSALKRNAAARRVHTHLRRSTGSPSSFGYDGDGREGDLLEDSVMLEEDYGWDDDVLDSEEEYGILGLSAEEKKIRAAKKAALQSVKNAELNPSGRTAKSLLSLIPAIGVMRGVGSILGLTSSKAALKSGIRSLVVNQAALKAASSSSRKSRYAKRVARARAKIKKAIADLRKKLDRKLDREPSARRDRRIAEMRSLLDRADSFLEDYGMFYGYNTGVLRSEEDYGWDDDVLDSEEEYGVAMSSEQLRRMGVSTTSSYDDIYRRQKAQQEMTQRGVPSSRASQNVKRKERIHKKAKVGWSALQSGNYAKAAQNAQAIWRIRGKIWKSDPAFRLHNEHPRAKRLLEWWKSAKKGVPSQYQAPANVVVYPSVGAPVSAVPMPTGVVQPRPYGPPSYGPLPPGVVPVMRTRPVAPPLGASAAFQRGFAFQKGRQMAQRSGGGSSRTSPSSDQPARVFSPTINITRQAPTTEPAPASSTGTSRTWPPQAMKDRIQARRDARSASTTPGMNRPGMNRPGMNRPSFRGISGPIASAEAFGRRGLIDRSELLDDHEFNIQNIEPTIERVELFGASAVSTRQIKEGVAAAFEDML